MAVAVRTVIIDRDFDGQRVDNYLLRELKGVPRSKIYNIIRKGEVRLNGGRIKANTRLTTGDKLRIPPVRIGVRQDTINEIQNIEKTIIYETDFMLIINKPANIAVHGGSGVSAGIIESLRSSFPPHSRLELIHRLDRDTSGCLMIAKNRRYLRVIQEALRSKSELGKYYLVGVHGQWPKRKTLVSAPIVKNLLNSGERVSRVSASGKESLTGFQVLVQQSEFSLLEAKAITGRTHQIRVHCRHAGFPVIGDPKYGSADSDRAMKRRFGFQRMMLHAHRLEIPALDGFPAVNIVAPLDEQFNGFKNMMENI